MLEQKFGHHFNIMHGHMGRQLAQRSLHDLCTPAVACMGARACVLHTCVELATCGLVNRHCWVRQSVWTLFHCVCAGAEKQWAKTVRVWGEGDLVAGQLGQVHLVCEESLVEP